MASAKIAVLRESSKEEPEKSPSSMLSLGVSASVSLPAIYFFIKKSLGKETAPAVEHQNVAFYLNIKLMMSALSVRSLSGELSLCTNDKYHAVACG